MPEPESPTWPGGDAPLAVSIVVNVEEGSEMSVARGDPFPEPVDELGVSLRRPYRNHGNESNYLYGIKAGAPRVMDLLEQFGMPATFTAAAMSLENAPELARRIAAGPHEVCGHGWRWVFQHRFDEAEEREFIRRAADSIARTTGARPQGWLSRYLLTDNTRRLLAEEGFAYHMDDYSDDVPFWDRQHPILILPYALDSNDMKMWTEPAFMPRHWLEYAIDTFEWLWREARDRGPRMMSLGLHLRIIGRPGRIGYLQRFLEHAAGREGVWFATRADIARAWTNAYPRADGSGPTVPPARGAAQ